MDEKEKREDPVMRVLKSFLRGAFVLALVLYLLYHLTNGFSVEMKTQIVKPMREELSVSAKGVIVRDERVVTSDTVGVVSYLYDDGTKVKIGAKLAGVYSGSANAETVARIAEIDRTVELLSLSEIDERTTVSDGAAASKKISSLLMKVSENISRGSFLGVGSVADEILATAVRRDTILSDDTGAGATLGALIDERDRLASTLDGVSAVVKSPEAGYFYSHVDGGETAFDFDSVKTLSAKEYSVKLDLIGEGTKGAVGKIVRSPKWYLLLPMENGEAKPFKPGKKYDVYFGGDGISLSMSLEAKNEGEGECLLVFSSKLMPNGFSFDRVQNVSVVSSSVEGYKLPASALRVVDGYVGVYIRSGNNIKFRAVEQIYESGTYTFVAMDTEGVTLYAGDDDETNDIYCKGLTLYDAVIISGAKELSPDRIVN